MHIGLLSDTHGYVDGRIISRLQGCDEIWHAGDIGSVEVMDALERIAPMRAVSGNIDGREIRLRCSEDLHFTCEGLKVFITHIGGYPGNYFPAAEKSIKTYKPELFICGHSHILRVMPDPVNHLLHMNPGAAGKQGFHKYRTLIRFSIENGKVLRPEVVELGLRGSLT